jgi:hypothetical protein
MKKLILLFLLFAVNVKALTTNPVVYIAGSQAFSALDNAALDDYAAKIGYKLVATTGNVDPKKAKALLYVRTNSKSIDIINVHQTGSEAGLQSAASGGKVKVPFLDNNVRGLGLADTQTNYPNNNTVSITTSPIYQKNSRFYPGSKLGGFIATSLTEVFSTSNNRSIAVQVWGWSVGTNFPTNALDITSETAQALFINGHVPLSYFTSNPNDQTNGVWLIGRDVAAGARIVAQITAGYGGLNSVRQYQVTNTINSNIALAITPSLNVLNSQQPLGNGGYPSTSSQSLAAQTILPSNVLVDSSGNGNYGPSPYSGTNYLIQYNSYANTVNVTNRNGIALYPLNFNGVPPTTNGVISGSYTLWTYEHLYVSSKASTNAQVIAQSIANYIGNLSSVQMSSLANASGYLNINDIKVLRNTDSGPVFLK